MLPKLVYLLSCNVCLFVRKDNMRVQKIINTQINNIDYKDEIIDKTTKIDRNQNNETEKYETKANLEPLLKTLGHLENNIHLDNSHPLNKPSNAPIESFEEAIIELGYFKTPFFKVNASAAQANLKNQDVLYLFK